MTLQINIAKEHFYNKNYLEAFKFFCELQDYYSAGLCMLLTKNTEEARKYWKKSPYSPASHWGLAVLDLINLKKPRKRPEFFQVRAQLEIYINLFLENDLIEWTQNLIAMCDYLHQSNPESYKFIARALYSNGYFDLAITFCKKSLSLFYCDPEALLILSQCHYLIGNLHDALDYTNRINNMVDNYFPSIMFKKILEEEIRKKENS